MPTLLEGEVQALREAFDDECLAVATYDQVLRDFGPVRPFLHIRDAEARHLAALREIFTRYDIPLPDDRWHGKMNNFASVREACAAAVAAEEANGALYERLLEKARHDDIAEVFRNLRDASQNRHLPAFRRCLERGGEGGHGQAGAKHGCGEGRRHRQGQCHRAAED